MQVMILQINISIQTANTQRLTFLSKMTWEMHEYKYKIQLHKLKTIVSVKLNDEDDEVEATSWTTKMPKAAQPNLNYIG